MRRKESNLRVLYVDRMSLKSKAVSLENSRNKGLDVEVKKGTWKYGIMTTEIGHASQPIGVTPMIGVYDITKEEQLNRMLEDVSHAKETYRKRIPSE